MGAMSDLRLWMGLFAGALLSGCATLNTLGMSEHCANLYNACLNACPKGDVHPPPRRNNMNWQVDVASCTSDCNQQAKNCH